MDTVKNLILFALPALFSSSAFAWPAVGDHATYDFVITAKAGPETVGVLDITIAAMDKTTDTITETYTSTVNGKASTSQQLAKLSDAQALASQMPSVLANCAGAGGVAETVTSPAGVFKACKFPTNQQKDFVWTANVPFGWVKGTETNPAGDVMVITIRAYQNGS